MKLKQYLDSTLLASEKGLFVINNFAKPQITRSRVKTPRHVTTSHQNKSVENSYFSMCSNNLQSTRLKVKVINTTNASLMKLTIKLLEVKTNTRIVY